MADTPSQHKQMPDRMHILMFVEEVKDTSNHIGNASGNQPIQYFHRIGPVKDIQQRLESNKNHPTHRNVANRFI